MVHTATSRVKAVRDLLLRLEPDPDNGAQNLALYNAIQAVDHLKRQLTESLVPLSECVVGPNVTNRHSQEQPNLWVSSQEAEAIANDVRGGRAPLKGEVGEIVSSSQEDACLLLGASQVSLSGSVCGSQAYFQQSQDSQPEQVADSTSPVEVNEGDGEEGASDEASGSNEDEPKAKRPRTAASGVHIPGQTPTGVTEVVKSERPEELYATSQEQNVALDLLMSASQERNAIAV